MTKIIRKYNSVFLISAIFYLNFYFLSPFIHEHPLKTWGQTETRITLHSHLANILKLNSNELNNVDYVINPASSHTHNYAFNTPIINQQSQNFEIIISHENIKLQDDFIEEVDKKNEIMNFARFFYKAFWERSVHFAANSSPPLNV
jgi:hypothetical protein